MAKMAINRVGPRLTLAEQMSRNPKFRGRQLAVETRVLGAGNRMVRATDMRALVENGIKNITTIVLSRASEIELLEMTAISDNVSIMREEITVGLFEQVMEGYKITGRNAKILRSILADPSQAGEALTYVNLHDAREFATRLSEQTGRKFRVQTEEEWLAARDRLSGENWTWTETPDSKRTFVLRKRTFVLRHLDDGNRGSNDYPGYRSEDSAVRLVEDR